MKLVLVGGGGHGRSVLEAVRTGGQHEVVACTDPRPELAETTLDGVRIVGDDSHLPALLRSGTEGACLGVGGTHDNGPRLRLFEHLEALGFALPAIVHGAATVARNAEIGRGSVILAAAAVGPGACIAENVIVNTGVLVEHDCVLHAHVHVATGAVLGGRVVVERLAHVGLGASVTNGARIGANAIVGTGSVVIRDVDSDTTVAGCPAAPLQAGR